jgi:UDP-glucose:(heptosyl)LPS alpha-1,3-glucosyltransferase
MARRGCDVIMSFDRIAKQDVFRSGGGPHKTFIQKMVQRGGIWRKLWYRTNPYHRLALLIEKRQVSSSGSRKIIALCKQVKREFIAAYDIPEEKIVVVYNGVDTERFHPRLRPQARKKVRAELGIPAESPVVLFVGTGFRRKGLDRMLEIWREQEMASIYLMVVGNDVKLSSYRIRHGGRNIIFTGPRSNVEDFYGAADLLVLPSFQEGFGNVVLEAFAAGVPVVTVAGVGAAEIIEGDLRNGIVDDPDDPAELKSKILRMLDSAHWEMMSRKARQVAEKYTWSAYLDGVEKTLYESCGQSQHSPIVKKADAK